MRMGGIMELKNPLYQNIGIHVINTIFTIDKGQVKVLLIKRTNEPYKGMWSLVGGTMYNNEKLIDAAARELKEKANIENIKLIKSEIFDDLKRSPLLRMIAVSYIGMVDIDKVNVMKKTTKTSDAEWFSLDNIPTLAYDHNEILTSSTEKLKDLILTSDILKTLYPKGFTIPEIHKVFESVLDKKLDRRNFRKKLLSSGLIVDTNKTINFEGRKPAKLYKFNAKKDKKLF